MHIVRTSTDSETVAKDLAYRLVESHAAVSVHIRKINAIYQWKGNINDVEEYEIEALVNNPSEAKAIIIKYHNYDLPEFFVIDITTDTDIENWCREWCNKK